MIFSSSIFIFLFLPCVLFVYYGILGKSRKYQNIFLFFSSLFFYAWGEPWFVFIMLLSIIGNWIFGLFIDKYRDNSALAKLIIATMLFFNILIIFIFKYLMFTIKNINSLLNMGFTVPNIILPIGISFFTFQAISYVIDVYRQHGEVQRSVINVGLYISFFPQLIAGPIVRYETVAEQMVNRKESFKDFSEGTCRFIIGLGKKVLLSNTLALVADKAFSIPQAELSTSFAWLGAIAYTLQIFFDFSGYSDMAIGLGKMFGFHFLENFDYPYISKSISEFWRRWHISLGSWFRDYVYFPLGGSRVGSKRRLVFNLFIVWFLTGIWHGANWTFISWGLLYFILVTFEKLTNFEKDFKYIAIRRIYTMLFVILGWVIFRSDSLTGAITYIKTMFFANGSLLLDENTLVYLNQNKYFFLFAIIFSYPVSKLLPEKFKNHISTNILYVIGCLIILITSMSYIVKGAYNPFIYFNF
ncbi:MAG: MBOAT family O-acyltransferase [Clostridia bacterium]